MPEETPTRRQILKRSALATAAAVGLNAKHRKATAAADEVDRSITVRQPPDVQQSDVLFDRANYTAFPHVTRLDGDELLMAFRQAPSQQRVRHVHPRSIITVMRSPDLGQTWDVDNASQLAAGGGQEFAPIFLGGGLVGGLLAMHEVVPVSESSRSGIPRRRGERYTFRNVGGFWCWSENSGLTWPLHNQTLFAPRLQTCSTAIKLSSGTLLAPCYGSGTDEPNGASSNVVYRSDDGGRTWSNPVVLARGSDSTRDYYEPALLETQRGHILAMHRIGRSSDDRDGLIWQNESHDDGITWSDPVETNISSGACPRLLKLADGRILLTYGRRYEPYGLYARLSGDGGRSWSDTSWLLRAAPNRDQGYSSSVEIEPGRVFTACYAQNADGVTGITGTFWSLPPD